MKPYRTIPIEEGGEPLVAVPAGVFLLTEPHPYASVGAPYGASSPWFLRQGVLAALTAAQDRLRRHRPDWRFLLFDGYRPNTVQRHMVGHEFRQLSGGRPPETVPETERQVLWERVFRIWAEPSDDPATPPPHSTGAALDVTLADAAGQEVWMGSPIDENSDRSNPDYFADQDPAAHANRQLLFQVMSESDFTRHWGEWWHFSRGDQMWAWLKRQNGSDSAAMARYGRADLLP